MAATTSRTFVSDVSNAYIGSLVIVYVRCMVCLVPCCCLPSVSVVIFVIHTLMIVMLRILIYCCWFNGIAKWKQVDFYCPEGSSPMACPANTNSPRTGSTSIADCICDATFVGLNGTCDGNAMLMTPPYPHHVFTHTIL